MASDWVERKLAAIMFTDIVGSTALMAESEQKGLGVRERHRALVVPVIEQYGGEAIEAKGDETLSVFGNALDAVNCALAIHGRLAGDAELKLHIGIHSSDILLRPGEISGDGVNIAARICALSDGDATYVSAEVHQAVRNQPHLTATSLGEHEFKNVGRPVAVFRITGEAGVPSPARQRPAPATGEIRSLAVLPLENLSGDPEQEYFADGMTEALIGDLAKIGALRIISRTSVMQYKRERKPLPEIARELNVDGVVEGTVMRAGNRVRITAQLIDARSDVHLWSERYDRELSDVLALQSDVARAVAQEIRMRVTPEEQKRLTSARPVDPEAYEAYLKGAYHSEIFARGGATHESLRTSIEYHQEAARRDPGWALAHAGLAGAYHWLASSGGGAEFWPKSKAAALKALELDDGLAQAHASLGFVLYNYDWDWGGAERELRRAVELEPNSYNNWLYALFSLSAGRYEEAIASYRRAEERDPNSLMLKVQLGMAFECAGQYDEAVEQLQKVIELDPDYADAHQQLGDTYLRKSMYEEAIAELEKATELSGASPSSFGASPSALLGYAYARAGRTAEAQEILRELEPTGNPFLPALYVALGEKDKAFAQYEAAYERHSSLLLYLRCGPEYDSLQDDPRFQDLLRRIGFPEE